MRIVLATNFQILDEERSVFWNGFAEKLGKNGIFLLILTTNVHDALTAPYIEIPYTLSGFGQFALATPPSTSFVESQIAIEAYCQWPENLAGVEIGAVHCAAFFGGLLDVAEPDLVLCWNTLLPQGRILQLACAERGIASQTIEQGLLPGTMLVDSTGNHIDGSLANSFALLSMFETAQDVSPSLAVYREWFIQRRPSKYQKTDDVAFRNLQDISRSAGRTILILGSAAGQGLGPADHMMARRTLPGVADLQAAVETIAEAAGGALLIYRGHPTDESLGLSVSLPANVELGQDASLAAYLEIADHVIVVGGSAAVFECLVLQKPVMVVGRNMLSRFKPCPHSDGSDLRSCIPPFLACAWQDVAEQADRVLSFLLDHYLIMQHPELEIGHQLDSLVRFVDFYSSRNELTDQTRIEKLQDWIQGLAESGQ